MILCCFLNGKTLLSCGQRSSSDLATEAQELVGLNVLLKDF